MSDWTLEDVGNAVTDLLPSGFFKHGATYEDAYLAILELVNNHGKELRDIVKKRQPDNWFLEMYRE